MKKNQLEAIKKLEAALLSVKRAGLVLVGIDGGLIASVNDEALKAERRARSAVEAILDRINDRQPSAAAVDSHGAYLDSGGA